MVLGDQEPKMDKMAVNNALPWRSPLSFNLRDNDCFDQDHSDMFQNLEKLIASAVSICRLDGSLQCQIGGLITVIEELQRLLRHSFAEIKRLEKTIDNQKRNYSGNISNLNKQIKELQSGIGSKGKLRDFTPQLFMPVGENLVTRRYSWNGEKLVLQAGKNINQGDQSRSFNISLVDESYGNEEESDNSIPNNVIGKDDQMENSNVEASDSVDQSNGLDHSLDASHKEEGVDEKNSSENEEPSSPVAVVEQHMENTSEEIVDAIASGQTIESSTKETTREATEETSRNLRNSSGKNTPSKDQSRRQSLVRSPRIHAKSTEKLVNRSRAILSAEKARRKKNQGSLFGGRNSKVNKNRQKTVSEKGNGSSKVKVAQSRNHTPNGASKKKAKVQLQSKRTNSKHKDNLQKKQLAKDNGTQTKAPKKRMKEKPMDKYINLDFLLMVNQVMSDLVSHVDREEAALDEVKESERKDVMNLAKLYRLRVRMAGKCEEALPVVLVKGRESCLPKPGAVDSLLSAMSDTSANKMQASLLKISGNKHRLETETNSSAGSKSKKRRV